MPSYFEMQRRPKKKPWYPYEALAVGESFPILQQYSNPFQIAYRGNKVHAPKQFKIIQDGKGEYRCKRIA